MHGLSCSVACGIFPDQGLNPCLLHWRADSLPLSLQGSPKKKILKQGMGRREIQKHEGLVCIYVFVHPTHPVPKTLATSMPKGTESILKIYTFTCGVHLDKTFKISKCHCIMHSHHWMEELRNGACSSTRVPRRPQLLTFWAGEFFAGGAGVCIVRCFAASLASMHLMLVATLSNGDNQQCPIRALSPLVEDLHNSHRFG